MISFFNKLKVDDRGATAVEYGLILAMIVLAMIAALSSVGSSTIEMWTSVDQTVGDAMNASNP